MRQLTESASLLVVDYPAWLGLACLATIYALSWWFIKTAHRSKRRISQIAAGIGGIIFGTVFGYGALTDRLALDASGVRETRFLNEQSAAWKDVVDAAIEERTSGKRGKQPHLVLKKAPFGEFAADVSGLSPAEIERVLAFAKKHVAAR